MAKSRPQRRQDGAVTASVRRVGTAEEAPLPPPGKSDRDAGVPESEIHFLPLHVLICLFI